MSKKLLFRLESLWQNELVKKGPVRASFGRAIWKFVRTRVLISSLTFLMSCLMGFISPVSSKVIVTEKPVT